MPNDPQLLHLHLNIDDFASGRCRQRRELQHRQNCLSIACLHIDGCRSIACRIFLFPLKNGSHCLLQMPSNLNHFVLSLSTVIIQWVSEALEVSVCLLHRQVLNLLLTGLVGMITWHL